MVRPRFDLGSTSKPLNLSLLRFNEWSGLKTLGIIADKNYIKKITCEFQLA